MPPPPPGAYYHTRASHRYNALVRRILRAEEEAMVTSILDVGGWKGEFVSALEGIHTKRLVDLNATPGERDGVVCIRGDFMDTEVPTSDIVTCLQVLEHLDDQTVGTFARRLFSVARKKVIISVPFHWSENACRWHKQDPVTREKLAGWVGRPPTWDKVVREENGMERLVCVYDIPEEIDR